MWSGGTDPGGLNGLSEIHLHTLGPAVNVDHRLGWVVPVLHRGGEDLDRLTGVGCCARPSRRCRTRRRLIR
jgi:hypothetical protein